PVLRVERCEDRSLPSGFMPSGGGFHDPSPGGAWSPDRAGGSFWQAPAQMRWDHDQPPMMNGPGGWDTRPDAGWQAGGWGRPAPDGWWGGDSFGSSAPVVISQPPASNGSGTLSGHTDPTPPAPTPAH